MGKIKHLYILECHLYTFYDGDTVRNLEREIIGCYTSRRRAKRAALWYTVENPKWTKDSDPHAFNPAPGVLEFFIRRFEINEDWCLAESYIRRAAQIPSSVEFKPRDTGY